MPESLEHKIFRQALLGIARQKRTISYRDLAAQLAVAPPHTIHKVTVKLEDLVRADATAGVPLLASVATSKGEAGIPGRGFFQLIRDLGLYDGPDEGPEARAWHARELARVFEHWGGM